MKLGRFKADTKLNYGISFNIFKLYSIGSISKKRFLVSSELHFRIFFFRFKKEYDLGALMTPDLYKGFYYSKILIIK